ncbi:MAG: spore coat associated protein CotJA [Oscillospiraceae bacterium]
MEAYKEPLKPSRQPGYSYVPVQRMEKVYSPGKALKAGTIFPELNITIDEYERGLYNGK